MALSIDLNLNSYSGAIYDKNTGKPIAAVEVSNGRDVVLTDERGH